MAFYDVYKKQAELLMRVLPYVAKEDCFALKGGTAINLFVRDLPRLSVDIDLTFAADSLSGSFWVWKMFKTFLPSGGERSILIAQTRQRGWSWSKSWKKS